MVGFFHLGRQHICRLNERNDSEGAIEVARKRGKLTDGKDIIDTASLPLTLERSRR